MTIKIYTIGFTKKSAERFFGLLNKHGVKRVIDTRLNNVSQLAGFSKQDDLKFFLKKIGKGKGIEYAHMPEQLAPTQDILDAFKKRKGSWAKYRSQFRSLIRKRKIEELNPDQFNGACLLCSEAEPHHCHRLLVAEYLKEKWGDVDIVHLPVESAKRGAASGAPRRR